MKKPEFYLVKCKSCDFHQDYIVGNFCAIPNDSPDEQVDVPEHVDELPKVCPKCGGKLEKKKIPGVIKY